MAVLLVLPLFEQKLMRKSSDAGYFCWKIQKKLGFSLSGIGGRWQRYFQRMAALLGVEFLSNWGCCLVSVMTKSPKEACSWFLFLDEFNQGKEADQQDLNLFMRVCKDLGFYLIIITSSKDIADKIMDLNLWVKMWPLKFIHNGPTTNIEGQLGYNPNKKVDWKSVNWMLKQLKNFLITKVGQFHDYSFLQRKSKCVPKRERCLLSGKQLLWSMQTFGTVVVKVRMINITSTNSNQNFSSLFSLSEWNLKGWSRYNWQWVLLATIQLLGQNFLTHPDCCQTNIPFQQTTTAFAMPRWHKNHW